jgi:glycosyltransferase involved in cell wall biosynthesis
MLKVGGSRVIYDVHEDVPGDVRTKPWIAPPLRRPMAAVADVFERLAGHYFDAIFATTPLIAERFPPDKTITLQNFSLADEFAAPNAIPYFGRLPNIAYIGRLSLARGAHEMLTAVEMIPGELGARLLIAGMLVPPLSADELPRMPGGSRVRFLGQLSREDVAEMLGQCRIGVVLFHPVEGHVTAMPNKLFEYMSAGIPIVASDFPLWRPYVEGPNCGLLVEPCSPAAAADAMRWLLENPIEAEAMGRRGQEAVRTHFNWEGEASKMVSRYERLLAQNPTTR